MVWGQLVLQVAREAAWEQTALYVTGEAARDGGGTGVAGAPSHSGGDTIGVVAAGAANSAGRRSWGQPLVGQSTITKIYYKEVL